MWPANAFQEVATESFKNTLYIKFLNCRNEMNSFLNSHFLLTFWSQVSIGFALNKSCFGLNFNFLTIQCTGTTIIPNPCGTQKEQNYEKSLNSQYIAPDVIELSIKYFIYFLAFLCIPKMASHTYHKSLQWHLGI